MSTTVPAAAAPAAAPAVAPQKPDLNAILAPVVAAAAPFLVQWLLSLLPSATPQPGPQPQPGAPPHVEPDLEAIEPRPDAAPVPAITLPVIGVRRLDILAFIFEPGGRIFYHDITKDLDGNVVGDGKGYWDRMNGIVPLNVRTKIMVSPTIKDVHGRELTTEDWERLGWRNWNAKYRARIENDPSNAESTSNAVEAVFSMKGDPAGEIVVEPPTNAFNVGVSRYRNTHGDSATYNVFVEGLLTLTVTLEGHELSVTTDPRSFVVR